MTAHPPDPSSDPSAERGVPTAPRGAPDWLPPRSFAFDAVEAAFLDTTRLAGYHRVRTPVFEHTEVFARGVGASTDVVNKEMYTFADKGGRSLTLRPEGTVGLVRAALEAGVDRAGALPAKWSYAMEFFRHERPQAGRQRQFSQVGVEALGSGDPLLDAECVWLGWAALRRAGLGDGDFVVRLNTLGDRGDRAAYHEVLNAYLDAHDLPPEVQQRRVANPLRAFDAKAPGMAAVMADAPLLPDHVGDEARDHHARVVAALEAEGVPLVHDPRLVRGLDYYTRTTFEFTAPCLGAQDGVGGGGRYDGLAEDLGSDRPFPGVGWALGVDRTVLALQTLGRDPVAGAGVTAFVVAGRGLDDAAFGLVTGLRAAGVAADMAFGGRSFKAQMKVADRAGATWAVVLGSDEAERGVVGLKHLPTGEQSEVARDDLVARLCNGRLTNGGHQP